ncbi:protein of unknown function [Hyphomicrobium sp. MC1]|nr:protein of unknown function [Hyphomicrobium sp. MC1]
MTPYFRSYAANFNRIRLLEMIDYREPQTSRREMQQLPRICAQERENRAFSDLQFVADSKRNGVLSGIIP